MFFCDIFKQLKSGQNKHRVDTFHVHRWGWPEPPFLTKHNQIFRRT